MNFYVASKLIQSFFIVYVSSCSAVLRMTQLTETSSSSIEWRWAKANVQFPYHAQGKPSQSMRRTDRQKSTKIMRCQLKAGAFMIIWTPNSTKLSQMLCIDPCLCQERESARPLPNEIMKTHRTQQGHWTISNNQRSIHRHERPAPFAKLQVFQVSKIISSILNQLWREHLKNDHSKTSMCCLLDRLRVENPAVTRSLLLQVLGKALKESFLIFQSKLILNVLGK